MTAALACAVMQHIYDAATAMLFNSGTKSCQVAHERQPMSGSIHMSAHSKTRITLQGSSWPQYSWWLGPVSFNCNMQDRCAMM